MHSAALLARALVALAPLSMAAPLGCGSSGGPQTGQVSASTGPGGGSGASAGGSTGSGGAAGSGGGAGSGGAVPTGGSGGLGGSAGASGSGGSSACPPGCAQSYCYPVTAEDPLPCQPLGNTEQDRRSVHGCTLTDPTPGTFFNPGEVKTDPSSGAESCCYSVFCGG